MLLVSLTAGMFPQSGSKIPNGLFTPPAEPFLPPVDPSTPQLARPQTSPVPHQQEELEFKSLDENDEPWKDEAPACAVSHSDYPGSCDGSEGKVEVKLYSALDGGGWLTPCPGRFIPGKGTRYPLHRRLDGPRGRCGWVLKISPPLGFDPWTVQPVASRCTDWATLAHVTFSIVDS